MRKIDILGKKGIPMIFGKKVVSSKAYNQFWWNKKYITAKRMLFKDIYLDFKIEEWTNHGRYQVL